MINDVLKLNFNSPQAEIVFHEAINNLPRDVDVYVVGGSIRNALFREFHGQVLTQRDYDQVITRGTSTYENYLNSIGFEEHPYPSKKDLQTVYRKPLFENKNEENYHDWIVFDMHTVDGTTIEDNLQNNVSFTINGCAINCRDILTKPWKECLIQTLPTALKDIEAKKLRLNLDGYKELPSNFFAALRFMSVGFSAPSKEEVELLLKELPRIEHERFDRNVRKVWDYVGGEEKARELVKQLGVSLDVFNEEEVKNLDSTPIRWAQNS